MELSRRKLTATVFGSAMLGLTRSLRAEGLAAPAGKTILTVSGKIGIFNVDNTAQFDRPMLEALGWSSFTTVTPWYNGPVKFEGVPMATLMQTVRATGETVVATALNDYATQIPISDFAQFNVLLALKRDGEYMPVRDKGPLFIVYPYDSNPDLKSQKYYSRSAWQLSRLVVT